MRIIAVMMLLSAAANASALELSYSVTNLLGRAGLGAARGLEFRVLFGGELGDQWSVWLGGTQPRFTETGHLCHDVGWGAGCFEIQQLDGFAYAAVNRRFYLRPSAKLKLYAGTGVGYRDITTCISAFTSWGAPQVLIDHGEPKHCIPGDLSVSSRWVLSQELGLVWRRVLDLSFGHFSTGGISEWNRGDNFLRFGFTANLKRKSAPAQAAAARFRPMAARVSGP